MRKLLITILLSLFAATVYGQFYYGGRGSAAIRWQQIDDGKYRLLFPEGFNIGARRYSTILDTIYPYINYNLQMQTRRIPIILRTENQIGNGFVVWAPKRDEMVTNAPMDMCALAWDKQISVHEYRHVAQMSQLRTGLTKVATWILGEAGLSVGLLAVVRWQLEGDAVNAETQFAEYGRGLQPDFTLGYRGLAMAGKLDFNRLDPWIAGSYKDIIPDIYRFGYQVMSAAETYCSPTVTSEVFRYSARYPILIVPDHFYLRKHYKTSYKDIALRAFAELDSIWQPTFEVNENFRVITSASKRLHADYKYPQPYRDKIIAVKWDMDHPMRFVSIDTATMRQRTIKMLGSMSSPPIIEGDKLYWTEYKPNPIYEQKNSSAIRSLDLQTGKTEVFDRWGVNYCVTPLPDKRFATISTDQESRSFIKVYNEDFTQTRAEYRFKEYTTLHSLAWDDSTKRLYFIALDDRGMWIGTVSEDGFEEVTKPSVVTVKNLRAGGGKLFFSSIASGKDEVHYIDLATGREYQQTTSKLASECAAPDKGTLLLSSYSERGWMISRTELTDTTIVEWSRLPRNILNPKRYQWDVPKIDTIKISRSTTPLDGEKRYRKALHYFNVHSWAPIGVDGKALINERQLVNPTLGVSLFFQSTLSDMRGYATYGRVNNMNLVSGGFIFTGLPVRIDVNGEYGGGYQLVYVPLNYESSYEIYNLKPYVGVGASFYLPLRMSKGANSKLLQPSVSFNYANSHLMQGDGHGDNLVTYNASVYWSSIMARGYRALMPRLGYTIQTTVIGALHRQFSTITNAMVRGYLPGFAKTHSFSLTATVQHQFDHSRYLLSSKALVPRGVVNMMAAKNYGAFRSAYVMPLFYPEFGIDGLIFFRRIWSEIFFDNSIGSYFTNDSKQRLVTDKHYSGGVVINIENNLIRSGANTVSLTFASSNQKRFWFGFNVAFDF